MDGTITATNADGNSGAIEITKKITIKGKNGAGTDMLDANSNHSSTPPGDAPATPHRIFTIKSGGNLTLENITLKNGKANGSGTDQNGGAIYNEGTLTIQNSNIENNMAVNGGGIYINKDAGACVLDNTTITDCEATSAGGGVCISNNRSLTLKGSTTITSSGSEKGKNDVFLTPYAYISIDGILSAPQVARISMADNNYDLYKTLSKQVLQGNIQLDTPPNYSKFTVTPQEASGGSKFWQINSEGKLE